MAREWVDYNNPPVGIGIRDVIKSQVGTTDYLPYPFENIMVREDYKWAEYNYTKYGTHQALELQHRPFNKDNSGAAHFRPDPNYKVKMLLYSEKNNYFQDQITSANLKKLDDEGSPVFDSYIVFTLDGSKGDYVSVDVAGKQSGIANFNLKVNGEWIAQDSDAMNNECTLVILGMEYYQEVDEETGFTEPPTQEERENEGFEIEYSEDDDDDGGDDGDITTEPTDKDSFFKVFVMGGVLLLIGSIVWMYLRRMGGEVIGE